MPDSPRARLNEAKWMLIVAWAFLAMGVFIAYFRHRANWHFLPLQLLFVAMAQYRYWRARDNQRYSQRMPEALGNQRESSKELEARS